MILRVYLLCFRFYTSITTICEKERKSSLNDQYLCLKDTKGCCNERRVQLGPKRPRREIQPTKEATQVTLVSRDARLCHVSKGETHVSTSLNPLHLRRTSQVSLKNRRPTSPRPSLQNAPFSTQRNCKASPINRGSHFSPKCPISCQRSAAEIVPRTAFYYSAFI